MKQLFQHFKNEDGAVTVDWVALTAGLIALALATIVLFQDIAVGQADWIAEQAISVGNDMTPG